MTRNTAIKVFVFVLVAALIGLIWWKFGGALSLNALAEHENRIRDYQQANPVLVYLLAFVLYVAITGLSLPGAAVLTLTYGWFFGVVKGVLVVSFASTLGATLAFLLSRYLFRDAIQNRFGDRLVAFNNNLEKEGPFYLFSLRLIPVVPFFVINAVMGLTKMKTMTFWWVSQLGMLAGTAVYVYAGDTVPHLSELAENGAQGILGPQLIVAFILLGIFPWIARKALSVFKGSSRQDPSDQVALEDPQQEARDISRE